MTSKFHPNTISNFLVLLAVKMHILHVKNCWISAPTSFKSRVEAISKYGTRDSEEEVDIKYNQILNKNEVQVKFN